VPKVVKALLGQLRGGYQGVELFQNLAIVDRCSYCAGEYEATRLPPSASLDLLPQLRLGSPLQILDADSG